VGRAVTGRLARDGRQLVLGDIGVRQLPRTDSELGPDHVVLGVDAARTDAAQEPAAAADSRAGR
jgi:hypothetical protein